MVSPSKVPCKSNYPKMAFGSIVISVASIIIGKWFDQTKLDDGTFQQKLEEPR